MTKDTRIAYGARCTWWGSIYEVGLRKGSRLPCCPKCGQMLFEMPDKETWDKAVKKYEDDGHPGYAAMTTWSRGKCFSEYSELEAAWASRSEW